MKKTLMLIAAIIFFAGCGSANKTSRDDGPIKILVLTGGHEFEHDPFFTLFQGYGDIEYVEKQLVGPEPAFEDISGWDYDVIVLYNMTDNISEKGKQNFVKLLDEGVGVVALHHAVADFQYWPEYKKMIGCRFYLNNTVEDGVVHEKSGYKDDVDVPVKVVNAEHPVTEGLRDFTIHDETYIGQSFEPDNFVLLTTDEPTSDRFLCWVRTYGNANICCIQPGHGPAAYNNANYRRLVVQAIRWCAGGAE